MAEYYVVRDKNTGLYFRGKGINRWGKYYNQASIYRVKANAENIMARILFIITGLSAKIIKISCKKKNEANASFLLLAYCCFSKWNGSNCESLSTQCGLRIA